MHTEILCGQVQPAGGATRDQRCQFSAQPDRILVHTVSPRFLATVTCADAVGIVGAPGAVADEGPPEVTTVRLRHEPGTVKLLDQGVVENPICIAPQYMAEELLSAEGFTDVRYISVQGGSAYSQAFERRELDFGLMFAPGILRRLDAGVPITVLAGVHPGCFELFVHEHIQSVADLKGKQVGIPRGRARPRSSMYRSWRRTSGSTPRRSSIGLRRMTWPARWSCSSRARSMHSWLSCPATVTARPQDRSRDRQYGLGQPWSQYYCCMLVGDREFVRSYPVASKRALRAILKATDLCATEPARVAGRLVDDGFAKNMITRSRY